MLLYKKIVAHDFRYDPRMNDKLLFLLVHYFIIQIRQFLYNEGSLPERFKLVTPSWLPSRAKQIDLIVNLKFPLLSFLVIISFVLLVCLLTIEPNFLICFL